MLGHNQIPVFLPESPRRENVFTGHIGNIIPVADSSYNGIDATPAAPRDLYRTCLPDELRQSPDDSTPENVIVAVNRSVQAFNTPFPVKSVKPPIADIVRVVSSIDDSSHESQNSSFPPRPSQSEPLPAFTVAVEPPTPFLSKIPMPDHGAPLLDSPSAHRPSLPSLPAIKSKPSLKLVSPPPRVPSLAPVSTIQEEQPNVDVNALSSSFQEPIVSVEYKSWCLLPTKKFSGFFVDGVNVASNARANSSRIVERLDFRLVKSASGAIIRLIGKPDEKRMLQFYISRSLISLFTEGFPMDWESLVDSEMLRLKRASEGIRERIITMLADLTKTHSQNVTIASHVMGASIAKPVASRTKQRHSNIHVKNDDGNSTMRLPVIAESFDVDGPKIGPHNFPIETFTPRNPKRNEDYEGESESQGEEDDDDDEFDDEETVREVDEPSNSSESMVEDADLSDDDRQYNQRRRARQGNKPAKIRAVSRSKKTSIAAVQSRRAVVSKKPAPKKTAPPKQQKASKKSSVGKKVSEDSGHLLQDKALKSTGAKISVVSPKKIDEQPSMSTDLATVSKQGGIINPPPKRVARNHPQVQSLIADSSQDLQSSQNSSKQDNLAAARKRKQAVPVPGSPPQITKGRSKKNLEQEEEEIPNSKPEIKSHRQNSESEPPAISKRVKKAPEPVVSKTISNTRSKAQLIELEQELELDEAQQQPQRTTRSGRTADKIIAKVAPVKGENDPKLAPQKPTSNSKKPLSKNDVYEMVMESPPKKTATTASANVAKKATVPLAKGNQAHSPVMQPNPMKNALAPQPCKPGTVRAWSEPEIDRLKRAILQVPTSVQSYWKAISNIVSTRNEDECFAMYNKRLDIQKGAQCTLMLSSWTANADTSMNSPPHSPAGPVAAKSKAKTAAKKKPADKAPSKSGKKVITAAAGTLKRREQIRQIVEDEAADEWLNGDDNQDAGSHQGGGLTQSERDALIGNNLALVTPSAGPASSSMITAGGQALSVADHDGPAHSMISSAFEMPGLKDRQEADKMVHRIRANAKAAPKEVPAGGKKLTTAQTLRKKASALDHLSPLAGKLKNFMPKNMSTPHIATISRRRYSDEEDDLSDNEVDDTLGNTMSTVTKKPAGRR